MSSLQFIRDRDDKRCDAERERQQRSDDAKFVRALALAYQRGEFPNMSASDTAPAMCEPA